ncbi:hypothetical protein HRW18_11160 [Streptomyces lunaelactis]|uniref:hypothetical protein n=1 Tax=Streptomyces lunaelactis TaxID=1535768 RepID=UPI0015855337|nr:hypothetical protein [Streptomyces lunaelactis]NUK08556.1 hypothetical protein [Streptomyces lunaelactis]NUL10027.1 hypothetical protein [Streptomyces lunaelactis]NUL21101.1 hypothetical protein [Streptomyces lunaelactis]
MSRSNSLPPPPPPVEMRAWPDRESLLADRAKAMAELRRRSIDPIRLVLLWLTAAGFAVGWAFVVTMVETFDQEPDPFSVLFGAIVGALGLGCMIPTGLVVGFGVAHDAEIRQRLWQWTALDWEPARDARFGSPVLSLMWFIPSFLLCASGLWLSFAVPAGAKAGEDTVPEVMMLMGLGFIMWLTGLFGAAKAVSHYRWAVRLVAARSAAATAVGGAHR